MTKKLNMILILLNITATWATPTNGQTSRPENMELTPEKQSEYKKALAAVKKQYNNNTEAKQYSEQINRIKDKYKDELEDKAETIKKNKPKKNSNKKEESTERKLSKNRSSITEKRDKEIKPLIEKRQEAMDRQNAEQSFTESSIHAVYKQDKNAWLSFRNAWNNTEKCTTIDDNLINSFSRCQKEITQTNPQLIAFMLQDTNSTILKIYSSIKTTGKESKFFAESMKQTWDLINNKNLPLDEPTKQIIFYWNHEIESKTTTKPHGLPYIKTKPSIR